MADLANSTPVPSAQIIAFPNQDTYVAGRPSFMPVDLPENVVRLYALPGRERSYTATSILLGEIVSVLTPKQFTQLTGKLRDRWRNGEPAAMAAFNLGVEGAYVS